MVQHMGGWVIDEYCWPKYSEGLDGSRIEVNDCDQQGATQFSAENFM